MKLLGMILYKLKFKSNKNLENRWTYEEFSKIMVDSVQSRKRASF